MINAASLCVADVESVLQSIAKLKHKVMEVYSDDELLDSTKPLMYPAVGVTYEGMVSRHERPGTGQYGSLQQGISAELIISILLLDQYSTATMGSNIKKKAPAVLDDIRDLMVGRTAPTGHRWRFVAEASAVPKKGTVIWAQRWACPVQLISSLGR